jgi:DNA-binding NarL/FixJ family response regulator
MSDHALGTQQAAALGTGLPAVLRRSASLADSSALPEPTRVLVATGVAIYEHCLVKVLGSYATIEVAGSARTVAEAIATADALHPDLVLLDVSLPHALDGVRALRAPLRRIPVLGFAVGDDRDVLACVEAGIAACVPREASLAELVSAMTCAMRGEALCSPRIAGALFRRVADLAERGTPGIESSALTNREREIVALIERGLSNKEIARQLGIELPTVKNHVHHILAKLSVGRRSEAAARLRAEQPRASL